MQFHSFIALFSKQSSKLQKHNNKADLAIKVFLIKLWEDGFEDAKARQFTVLHDRNLESILVIFSYQVKKERKMGKKMQIAFSLSRMTVDYCIL